MTSTDLATIGGNASAPIALTDTTRSLADWAMEMDAAHRLGKALCTTSFVPKDFRGKPEETAAAILTGAAMGLAPTTALQIMHVINGRVGMYAKGQVAILKSHGHDVWTVDRSDQSVTVAGRRKGWPQDREVRITITIEQAKQAGWTDNKTYVKTPQDMLYARAATRVCAEVAPELLYGIPVVEELADLPPIQAEATVGRVTGDEILGHAEPAARDDVDASTARDGSAPASREELAENFRLLSHAGYSDKDEALAFVTRVVGRPVASRTELTSDEIATVNAAIAAAGERLSDPQKRHIMALATELGMTDRDARLEYIGGIVGHPVATTNDLTGRQAHDVIEAMLAAKGNQEKAADDQPARPLREVAKDQAATLRRTRAAAAVDATEVEA